MKFNREKNLETILVIVSGCLVLNLILKAKWLLLVALFLLVVELVSDKAGGWLVWLWMKIAEVLGWFSTRILLSLVYMILLLPLAFFYKLFHPGILDIKKPDGKASLFCERYHSFLPQDMENIW